MPVGRAEQASGQDGAHVEARSRAGDGSVLCEILDHMSSKSIATLHGVDYFSAPPDEYAKGIQLMRRVLCEPTYAAHTSLEGFGEACATGVLRAYMGLRITNELDRYEASTAVARSIAARIAGRPVDVYELLQLAWRMRVRTLVSVACKAGHGLYVDFPIANGLIACHRLPGLGFLRGTPLFAHADGYAYRTTMGAEQPMEHTHLRDWCSPTDGGGDELVLAKGRRRVHCFVCNAPQWLVDECAAVLFFVAREIGAHPSEPLSVAMYVNLSASGAMEQLPACAESVTFS